MDKYLNYDAKKPEKLWIYQSFNPMSFQIRSRDYFLTIQNVGFQWPNFFFYILLALGKSVCCKVVHLLKLRAEVVEM